MNKLYHCVGEKLDNKNIKGLGDKIVVDGKEQKVGAGGLYGGVNLAVSDRTAQERNKAMLEALFERERRKREKA